jgi:hypothetical protein
MDQHFVTRFYLDAWCHPIPLPRHGRSLWECDLVERKTTRRPPKKVATEMDYYSVVTGDGTVDHGVESLLSIVESKGAPVVHKIRAGNFALTAEEREDLSLFIGFLVVRVPSLRNYMERAVGLAGESTIRVMAQHPEYFRRMVRKAMAAAGEEITEEEIEEARKAGLEPEKHFIVRGTRDFSLAQALKLAMTPVRYIHGMNWEFLVATGDVRFITGDTPLTWRNPNCPPPLGGLGIRGTEVTLPLSPTVCLLAKRDGATGVREVGDESVRDLNRERVRHADRFIYAPNETEARTAMETYKVLAASGDAHVPPFTMMIFEQGRGPIVVRGREPCRREQ